MRKMIRSGGEPKRSPVASFTLIELLTVMAIIAILASLVLYASNAVMIKAKRSRAAAEIQAMSTGLEGYKTDNGIYPPATGLLTNTYAANDGSQSAGLYQVSSQLLYQALSGQTNFNTAPIAGTKVYMSPKANQIGDPNGTVTGGTYMQDPWGNSYGYSTGSAGGGPTTNYPYNGPGFFDVWSTAGSLRAVANTNAWISNWQ